jgi:nitrile hydratase accessory protein
MSTGTTAPLAYEGPAAPPRSNGELVFAEPWESRAFGMAVALHDTGAFEWPTFQAALIARIKAWEVAHPDGGDYRYYRHWLDALEDVLAADGTVVRTEVDALAAALAARPAGYDHPDHPDEHGHGHGHGHGH